jgi:hypothetical protein
MLIKYNLKYSNSRRWFSSSEFFPNLLSPIKVAHLTLKNRVIMGSMHTGLEEPGIIFLCVDILSYLIVTLL